MEQVFPQSPGHRSKAAEMYCSWSQSILREWSEFVKLLTSKNPVELCGNSLSISIVVAVRRYGNNLP